MATTTAYTSESIVVLTGLDPVRRRPGMYFGDTSTDFAMHAMLSEIIGNSLDEHLRRGAGGYIRIMFAGDRVSVEDDGRGIPIDPVTDGCSALEVVMTRLHAGTAIRPHVHVRSDLGGCGAAAVCALASELVAEVWIHARAHRQRYVRGVPLGPVEDRGPTTRTGTRISFTPDFTVLAKLPWDIARVAGQARDLAALTPGLTMIVDDEACCYPDGVVDHVRYLAGDAHLFEPVHLRASHAGVGVEVALAWREHGEPAIHGFVNCARAGGTHVEGLLAGVRAAFAKHLASRRRLPLARGLLAILHVDLEDPRFGSPTREWLLDEEVGAAVRTVVRDQLLPQLADQPALVDWMLLRQLASTSLPATSPK
ncbi:MAG: ATP-binding protein [Kofleriaceae bacterium]